MSNLFLVFHNIFSDELFFTIFFQAAVFRLKTLIIGPFYLSICILLPPSAFALPFFPWPTSYLSIRGLLQVITSDFRFFAILRRITLKLLPGHLQLGVLSTTSRRPITNRPSEGTTILVLSLKDSEPLNYAWTICN